MIFVWRRKKECSWEFFSFCFFHKSFSHRITSHKLVCWDCCGIAAVLVFFFFVLMIHADLHSVRKPGRMSNLCFCALCREIKFYEIDILTAINLHACPLRSTVCRDWNKYQLEECCISKRQTSILAGILCFRDVNSLMLNSWTSSVFIKKTPNNEGRTKLSSPFQTLPVIHSTKCWLNPF